MDPQPPDKDSDQYKKLREGLKRKAEEHFSGPQAAPPSVKQAQEQNPELKPAKPLREDGQLFADEGGEVEDARKKKHWIKSPVLRAVICIALLGLTGYCLWFIFEFRKRGEHSEIWWPWQKPPVPGQRYATATPAKPATSTATTTAKETTTTATTTEAKPPALTEEEKKKLEEEKRAQQEAENAAKAEADRKKQEQAALAKAEADELQAIEVLKASLAGYVARFQYEQGSQQMSQLGGSLKTEKAKAALQQLWSAQQPFLEFKQTLSANVSAIQYAGKPLLNKQGTPFAGTPTQADAEKLYFTTKYGEVPIVWDNVPPEQIAALANFYLKAREQQSPSKSLGKDYYNLTVFCMSQKLTTQAAQAGTDAITIDQSLRPPVKAVLGNLIP